MNAHGEYLWDKSGAPEPDVTRFEAALGTLRFRPSPLDPAMLKEREIAPEPAPVVQPARRWFPRRGFAAAAGLLLALAGATIGHRVASGWAMEPFAGEAFPNSAIELKVGRWLETGPRSRARLAVDDIGHVTLDPGTRIRIRQSSGSRKVLELARGRIGAVITAPPRLFIVDGPGVRAVDLGCAYTLEIDEQGSGTLHVTMGFVELQRDGLTSTVPRGAFCATRAARGPGTPCFEDANPDFLDMVRAIDQGIVNGKTLELALALARPRDALTVWHLIPRTTPQVREAIVDRLAALVPIPGGISRDAVLRLDAAALEAWWRAIQF